MLHAGSHWLANTCILRHRKFLAALLNPTSGYMEGCTSPMWWCLGLTLLKASGSIPCSEPQPWHATAVNKRASLTPPGHPSSANNTFVLPAAYTKSCPRCRKLVHKKPAKPFAASPPARPCKLNGSGTCVLPCWVQEDSNDTEDTAKPRQCRTSVVHWQRRKEGKARILYRDISMELCSLQRKENRWCWMTWRRQEN